MSGTKIVQERVKNFESIKRRIAEPLSHIYVPTNNDISYKSILKAYHKEGICSSHMKNNIIEISYCFFI